MKNLSEKIQPLGKLFNGTWSKILARKDRPEIEILSLNHLNDELWGLHKQELMVIGARTSQGKTSFALQVAWDVASQNIPVNFFSLEMTKEALVERLFCQQMSVDNCSLRKGGASRPDIIEKARQFKDTIAKIPLLITNGIGKSITELYYLIERLGPKPAVIIIDYVQAIAKLKGETYEVMNEYIRRFRELSIKHNLCGILLSQINRGAMATESKEPALWLLKSTGVLEEHADTALLLHWDYFYSNNSDDFNRYDIIIAKQKNGVTGKSRCLFYPQFYRFEDISYAAIDEIKREFSGRLF
jgi:replicative DNA helicase